MPWITPHPHRCGRFILQICMNLVVNPPILPMLAKRVDEIPTSGNWIYEPKWDGFRILVFRDGDEVLIQSRDENRSTATSPR